MPEKTLPEIHCRLFGLADLTPATYRLTPAQLAYYVALDEGARGFAARGPGDWDPETFLATLTYALAQAQKGDTALVVTPAIRPKVLEALKKSFKQALRVRYAIGLTKEECTPLIESMNRLYLADRPMQMNGPPERWACYGFPEKCQPAWVQEHLALPWLLTQD
jgi:hypothetical protein